MEEQLHRATRLAAEAPPERPSHRKRPRLWEATLPKFRLEYRRDEGSNNNIRRHQHRFLIFHQDQYRGAIAKILFSEERQARNNNANGTQQSTNSTPSALHFTIHVLECKPRYRKCGLGSILLVAALQCMQEQLIERYSSGTSANENRGVGGQNCSMLLVHLNAEEDEQRYGKLVNFYTSFGFVEQQRKGLRGHDHPQHTFLYQQDSMYRKVPMLRTVCRCWPEHAVTDRRRSHSLGATTTFTPVIFRTCQGELTDGGMGTTDWMIVHSDTTCQQHEPSMDNVLFRSARGSNLSFRLNCHKGDVMPCDGTKEAGDKDGSRQKPGAAQLGPELGDQRTPSPPLSCYLTSPEEEDLHSFRIVSTTNTVDDGATSTDIFASKCVVLQSVSTGAYLSLDGQGHFRVEAPPPPETHLQQDLLSSAPTATKASSTPATWKLDLDTTKPHCALTLTLQPPLRHECLTMAQAVRQAGLPDWLQLVALVYPLRQRCCFAVLQTICKNIPPEGLVVLQQATETVWDNADPQPKEPAKLHCGNSTFYSPDQHNAPPSLDPFTADFVAALRNKGANSNRNDDGFHGHNDDVLWDTHFVHVCSKYGVEASMLEW